MLTQLKSKMEDIKEQLKFLVLEKGIVDIIMNYKKEIENYEKILPDLEFISQQTSVYDYNEIYKLYKNNNNDLVEVIMILVCCRG